MIDRDTWQAGLRDALAEVLVVEPEEIVPEAQFFHDLGGESLDLLDLEFQLGHRFAVKMGFAELNQLWQQDEEGRLTPESATRLKAAWPILRDGELESIAETGNWQQLVTVDLIQRLLVHRLSQPAACSDAASGS